MTIAPPIGFSTSATTETVAPIVLSNAADVAQAGGWKNHAVLATLYQQPDDATLFRVVSEPAELREAKA